MAGTPSLPGPQMKSVARLLGLSQPPAGRGELQDLIERNAAELGAALAAEAAASDDVHDAASAEDYLELRLTFLGDLVPQSAIARVRSAFEAKTAGW